MSSRVTKTGTTSTSPYFNEIEGLGPREDSPSGIFDHRPAWGSPQRLRGCQVHNFQHTLSVPLTHRTVLHELGHAWGMYVDLEIQDSTRHHWHRLADNGRSCMDRDLIEWEEVSPGRWQANRIDDEDFVYCPLDRYLMGLAPASDVDPIRVLPSSALLSSGPVNVTPSTVTVGDICAKVGDRVPAATPGVTAFRQAFVILSTNIASAQQCAARLADMNFLSEHSRLFEAATGGRATVDTAL